MPLTSPLPHLRGTDGAELRAEGRELVLTHPDRELRIPFGAVARVHAEQRGIAVELTAPAEVEPSVYRVVGVDAAAATVFADTVNAALPRPGGEPGTALTRFKRWSAGLGLALLAPAVAAGIAGGVAVGLAILFLGALGAVLTAFGGVGLYLTRTHLHLRRHGMAATAREVVLDGRTTYAYTDSTGATHPVRSKPKPTVRVSYDPRNPGSAVVHQPAAATAVQGVLSLAVAAFGIACLVGAGGYALDAFTG
ncbi:hypothetical protein ABZO31_10335 [Streptomyces sp. HUAS MG47]|uniref:hypothetical protein n=1 Tax=Streptomyces solicamelliae TaxID=3231716 RepID=UPI00387826BB